MSSRLNPKASPFVPDCDTSNHLEPPHTVHPTTPVYSPSAFDFYSHPDASARCCYTDSYQSATIRADRFETQTRHDNTTNTRHCPTPVNTNQNCNPLFNPHNHVRRSRLGNSHHSRPRTSIVTNDNLDFQSSIDITQSNTTDSTPATAITSRKSSRSQLGYNSRNMSHPGKNRSIHHRFKYIPTPRVAIYNVDSYSSRREDRDGLARRNRLYHNLNTIAKASDVVLTQETKTESSSIEYEYLLQPHWETFRNPNPDSNISGGTDMFVSKKFLDSFIISHEKIVPGFLQALHFYPKGQDSVFQVAFTIVNVYLPSGSDDITQAKRASILCKLAKLATPTKYVVTGGDWNLTQHASDSSGEDHFASNERNRKLLKEALAAHSLEEVYQPFHTCVRAGKRPTSSRIDRIYISHSLSDKCSMSPSASLPAHPYPPGGSDRSKGPSDHFPVLLSFKPNGLSKGARFKIPEWLATHPELLKRVRKRWNETVIPRKAAKAWLQLKKIITQEAKGLMKSSRDTSKTKAETLTLAISIYKGVQGRTLPKKRAEHLAKKDAKLFSAYQADLKLDELGSDLPKVQAHINTIFRTDPLVKPGRQRKTNFLKSAKNTLPSESETLTHLITDEGDRITESGGMADLLKKSWEPIWGHVDPDKKIISDYLTDYTKSIDAPPPKMSEEHFRTVMSKPRDSSTGPDGIPFSIYRLLVDIAAPLLYRYTLSIAAKGRVNRSFNYTNLFFFPKDSSGRVDRTRPISVSNTDNRIIANVVRRLISPALGNLLDDSQTAFIPGKLIEDPIFSFNEKFYGAKIRDETYSILFHDFKKAYDSVSREYLFFLLEKIGIPERLIKIIQALYSNVLAFPILTDPHGRNIKMSNGLKQGCPLSPLLFNLAIDPLLTKLSKIREADQEAYCDDIGIGSSDWEAFPKALNHISTFNKASNMASNASKTFIITTDPCPPRLCELLPAEWTSVRYTDKYKYLGVMIGPGVDVNEVFRGAWSKLESRIARYMPLKSFYNTQNRVIIANAFLSSIFSYLFRFYMMGEDYHRDVENLISSWLVPANRFRYDHLTASTREAGLVQPLQDIFKINIAAVLRARNSLPKPRGDPPQYNWGDGASLVMQDHVQRAVYFFHHLTLSHPKDDSTQHDLFKLLQQRDETSLYALADKWNNPKRSNYLGEDQSLIRAKLVISHTKQLPARLPSRIRYHIFELVHNAIPTKVREQWREHSLICALCNQEPETIDHLHKCPVSMAAVGKIVRFFPNKSDFLHLYDSSELDFTFVSECPTRDRLTLVIFSLAIWRTRRHYYKKDFHHSHVDKAARQIARYFIRTYQSIHRKKYKKSRNRIEERKAFTTLYTSIPHDHVCIFTDGSSLGNPGPSGAGYFASTNNILEIASCRCLSHHIPLSTNNASELTALSLAAHHSAQTCSMLKQNHNTIPIIHFFVDNKYTINTAIRKHRVRAHKQIVNTLLHRLDTLSTLTEYHIHWVPGHAGVYGNEIADWLAKRGAKGISSMEQVPHSVVRSILDKYDRDQLEVLDSKVTEEDYELELADSLDTENEDSNEDRDVDESSPNRPTTPQLLPSHSSLTDPATSHPLPTLTMPGDRLADCGTVSERLAISSAIHATQQPLRRSSRKRKPHKIVQGIDFSMHRPQKKHKPTHSQQAARDNSKPDYRIGNISRNRARPKRRLQAAPPPPQRRRLRQLPLSSCWGTSSPRQTTGAPEPSLPAAPATNSGPTRSTQASLSLEALLEDWDSIHGSVAPRDRASTASLGQGEGPAQDPPPPFASLIPLIENFHPEGDSSPRGHRRPDAPSAPAPNAHESADYVSTDANSLNE